MPREEETPCLTCGDPTVGSFCSGECRVRYQDAKARPEVSDGERAMLRAGVLDAVLIGDITQADAAAKAGIDPSTVYRVVSRVRERGRNIEAEQAAMYEMYFPTAEEEALELQAFVAVAARKFAAFRERFFKDVNGKPYIVKGFHLQWIMSLMVAIVTGSRMMVLSPPRHGKTSLLAHFMCWLIIWRPNIRIMWVGNNEPIASEAVGLVRDHLESNEELVRWFSPQGDGFRPSGRTGGYWQSGGFTVKTRTVTGIKSPTMVAVGRAGKILSRDCDVIIVDDIEDQESTESPTTRVRTRTWVTNTLESRKEDHTSMFCIGSRQHPDDLYGYLLDDPLWTSHVDSAHAQTCTIDPLDEAAHVDCMLMPEIRSYTWLMEKRRSASVLNNSDHFDMVYLQIPVVEGTAIFTRELCEPARNPGRGLGVPAKGLVVIGGLDPAATGYQAAFLWALDPETGLQRMVDLDNRRGGGIAEALKTFKWGLATYGCHHWVVEDNGFQRAIRQDKEIRDWAQSNGVYLEGHITGSQKADPHFGVGAMSRLFRDNLVDLPYGTGEARQKTDLFLQQAYNFTADGTVQRKRKSDVLMAAWFPQKAIRRTMREQQASVDVDYEPMFSGYQMSDWNEVPW